MRFWLRAAWGPAIVLLGALSSTLVNGASDTVVRIGSLTGASGQEVTARLEVLGLPEAGLGAFTIDVAFDPAVVSAVSCEGDPANALDSVACNPAYKTGTVRVVGFHMTAGLTGDTPLADITFRLPDEKGKCSDLTVSIVELTDPSTAPLSSRVENGSVCIGDTAAATSTPAPGAKTTPAATSKPGQPAGTVAPNGGQQLPGTAAPGETGSAVEAGKTPASSPRAASSTTQGSEEGGDAAKATSSAVTTGQRAVKQQAIENGGSGGGRSGWLIAIGVVVAMAAAGGIGVLVWKRRASRRL